MRAIFIIHFPLGSYLFDQLVQEEKGYTEEGLNEELEIFRVAQTGEFLDLTTTEGITYNIPPSAMMNAIFSVEKLDDH